MVKVWVILLHSKEPLVLLFVLFFFKFNQDSLGTVRSIEIFHEQINGN